MVKPRKVYDFPLNFDYKWYHIMGDAILFCNYLKVGRRYYQIEGVVIDGL